MRLGTKNGPPMSCINSSTGVVLLENLHIPQHKKSQMAARIKTTTAHTTTAIAVSAEFRPLYGEEKTSRSTTTH